ncbi:hypothetical protein KL921_000203 [Ogataea angusta]|uniref:DUF4484 domain-containing protein n=1 Tax=Pichia angusta TaxID=870730 RepID=A0ABQ7S1U6_PICAN|nr:hypothetical protein KL921_000203 [Ogataea angusta]KAG7842241.1 hypothetical protein KL942_000979 [Ogataea angusta]KAG7851964.1 hypothetical protein KL940_000846 [Ogataea angusta]
MEIAIPTVANPSRVSQAALCGMFLAKFDVHTGYELKWFRSLNESLYPSKGLEFKALPSGLHSVDTDIICFVHEKGEPNLANTKSLLYGILVFKQNLSSQKTVDGNVDRNSVKMYSLGVLVDPEHLNEPWMPRVYSSCWNYRNELNRLVTRFLDSGEEKDKYNSLEQFWTIHRFKGPNDLSTKFKDIMKNVNINRRKSIQTLTNDEPQNADRGASSESGMTTRTLADTSTDGALPKNDSDLDQYNIDDEHMVNYLLPLMETLGPLVYRLWKLALTRKKIIIYAPQNSHRSISELSKIVYCVSLISSIPKDLKLTLIKSRVIQQETLEHLTPLYNVCVNDIGFLKSQKNGFIASTSDQIILEKTELYHYSLQLPDTDQGEPLLVASGSTKPILATPRDFNRFKLVYAAFFENVVRGDLRIDDLEVNLPPHARATTEPLSLREVVWKGFSWWATAGSSESPRDEFEEEYDLLDDVDQTKVERLVSLIGYFQKLTTKLFTILVDIINNSESDHLNEGTSESDTLVDHASRDHSLWIEPHDLYEMGLDPYSTTDRQFVTVLCMVWWGREIKIGGYLGSCCCI